RIPSGYPPDTLRVPPGVYGCLLQSLGRARRWIQAPRTGPCQGPRIHAQASPRPRSAGMVPAYTARISKPATVPALRPPVLTVLLQNLCAPLTTLGGITVRLGA